METILNLKNLTKDNRVTKFKAMSKNNTDKADVLCFEKYYSDNSGVEFSVRYDRKPYLHDEKIIGYVTLEH